MITGHFIQGFRGRICSRGTGTGWPKLDNNFLLNPCG